MGKTLQVIGDRAYDQTRSYHPGELADGRFADLTNPPSLAALKLHDEALAERLVPTVLDLLQDDDRLASLATGARRLARPGAARAIAEELSKLTRNATWT